MQAITTPNQPAPCPVCGEKTLPATKDRPCALCGCTVDDPYGLLSDAEHSGAESYDFDQLILAMSDPAPSGDESPPSMPASWARVDYVEFCKKRKLARSYARKTGETLLLDDFSCPRCGVGREKVPITLSGAGLWLMKCTGCGESVSIAEVERAVLEIDALAEKETKFQAPDVPMVTLERALKDKAIEELRSDRRMVEVFPEKQLSAILEISSLQSGDADEKTRVRQTIKRLMESGGHRPLAVLGTAWQSQVDELQQHFPNFAGAISDVIRPSMAISAAGGRARPAPLLLVGLPGVGKSYFAESLAKILCVPRVKIDMASATIGACLSGLSSHWSNSGPGEVFKSLAFGRGGVEAVADPLIFLDEVDKVSAEMRYSPLSALFSLLEIESSKVFEDESLPGLGFDTSHIRWILCANETAPIPGPILSRVHVVHVREPTEIEIRNIRARIFSSVVKSICVPDFEDYLPPSVLAGAENQGPREFKTMSVMAIGKALARGKYRVSENDFASGLPKPVRRLGFM